MPQSEIGNGVANMQFILVCLGGCFGVINALFFVILRWIKKSIDSLWSKRNEDHDRIIAIETRNRIKDEK
jgi:hypothetical protein